MDPRDSESPPSGRWRWAAWLGALAALLVMGAAPAWAQADPPGRVGRLNYVQGAVSFSPASSDEWVEAGTSRPITTGDRLWTARDARFELSIGSAVLRADEETSLKVLQLDDDQAQFQLSEGTLAVHVRNMDPDDRLEIATPNQAFVIDRPGDYRIQVDPDNAITTIAVQRGRGTAYSDEGQRRLEAPAYARFVGGGLDQVSSDLPGRDAFDRWVDARIERDENRPANRYVSRDMVGYEDLDDYGTWSQEPDYGWVWAPRVSVATWAPYRYGHWAWVAPWGWTWVDDAPWGFAPFHYGRWAYVGSRWCWVPGPVVRRPYYAPALVAFVGSPSVSFTVSTGPAVAWFPLSPWDAYRPVYRASPTYVTRINRVVVVDRDPRRRPPEHYANRYVPGAATALPTRAFVEGRPVGRDHIGVPERELRQGPIAGTMPTLAPVRNSLVGQASRQEAPPRRDRERQVVTTRMPPAPPVERDELARRFAQGGGRVRDAGPPLSEQSSRNADRREDRAPRLVSPRQAEGPAGEERGPRMPRIGQEEGPRREPMEQPPRQQAPQLERREANRPPETPRAAEQERGQRMPRIGQDEVPRGAPADQPPRPQAPQLERREVNRPPETPRAAEQERGQRMPRIGGQEEGPRREAAEQPRPQLPQMERREAQRPPDAPRANPEPRREREAMPRGFGLNQETPARPDGGQPSRPQFERRQAQRPPEQPAPPPRPERQEERRQRPPEFEPRGTDRPGPQIGPDRNTLRTLRQEENRPRPQPQAQPPVQREMRAPPQPQAAPQPEQRRDEGGRGHKEQQQRERPQDQAQPRIGRQE